MKCQIAAAAALLCATAIEAIPPPVGGPDLSACGYKDVSFDFYGKVMSGSCEDCTTVSFIDSAQAGPAICKTYNNWVINVISGSKKIIFSNAAGILPNALNNVESATSWFDIKLTGSSAPTDTLPAGCFDKYANQVTQIFITSSAPIKIGTPAGVFANKMPKLKEIQFNLPTNAPSTGINADLFNANVNSAQTLQLKFGNQIDANLLRNMGALTTAIVFSGKATAIPASLFAANKKLNTIMIGGGVGDGVAKMPITALPEGLFSGLSALKRVSIMYTNLQTPPADLFSSNPAVSYVNLDNGEISEVPEALFANTKGLTEVYLTNNKLYNILDGLFSSVATPADLTVYLEFQAGTPLTCASSAAAIPAGAKCQ